MHHLTLDKTNFGSQFPTRPFTVRHDLANHPLFQLSRLVELSKSLPADKVEYNSGKLPVSVDPSQTPRNGLSIEETIRRIEECQSWMALKNVESDPQYKLLLDECLADVGTFSEAILGDMLQKEAFIFITSPGSVTPYHMDPEHNFLLQVRGNKFVHMFDGKNRNLLTEEELEGFYGGGHRNLVFKDDYKKHDETFHLLPGDGVHFPVTNPHWVQNGNEVSISFSITFRSAYSERAAKLYFINSRLRKLGVTPTPPGHVLWRDNLKYGVFRAALTAKQAVGFRGKEQSRDY